ncbi:meiotic recombination protein W68-like [Drosophila navojoa]|nr:meiotic recombination protein W68-like [Drosophila navojoa]
MSSDKSDILLTVEQIVLDLIASLMGCKKVTIEIPKHCRDWYRKDNYDIVGKCRKVVYSVERSRHRFCLIVYLLAEIHQLHLTGGSCTIRGLYYRDTQVVRSQSYIDAAKMDVCRMLNTAPVNLGILSASKGLITGDIKLVMSNGDVLDCNLYCGAITLPTDFENVERIVTNAEMVLIVEKESVFESLLACNALSTFGLRFILLTGKGYPDCTTRRIVYRLTVECNLPAYILVDADPFGIEIMLVYQLGSQAMSFSAQSLATPTLRWIGLHPSEIDSISKRSVPLTQHDNKKIVDILSRSNLSLGVRQELRTLQQVQLKAEIESVIDFLSPYYIPTKINRNLFI